MKPLHTSSQVTASDSLMVVRVMEISTPDGPVRRIVVEANAEMSPDEARWLRDKLDLAITLAEEGDARPDCQDCDCRQWTWNGRSHLLRSDPPSACVCGHETVRHHSEGLPVSEDQPKPPSRCPFCKTTHKFGPSDYCKAQTSEVLADSEQVRHG